MFVADDLEVGTLDLGALTASMAPQPSLSAWQSGTSLCQSTLPKGPGMVCGSCSRPAPSPPKFSASCMRFLPRAIRTVGVASLRRRRAVSLLSTCSSTSRSLRGGVEARSPLSTASVLHLGTFASRS